VAIDVTSGFKAGLPVALFRVRVPVAGNPYRQQYAASSNGQRFLVRAGDQLSSRDSHRPRLAAALEARGAVSAVERPGALDSSHVGVNNE
jgi:hypothetical protein